MRAHGRSNCSVMGVAWLWAWPPCCAMLTATLRSAHEKCPRGSWHPLGLESKALPGDKELLPNLRFPYLRQLLSGLPRPDFLRDSISTRTASQGFQSCAQINYLCELELPVELFHHQTSGPPSSRTDRFRQWPRSERVVGIVLHDFRQCCCICHLILSVCQDVGKPLVVLAVA